ncbi:MAG: hypothetical protein JXQ99_17970 [Hyphomicrobiaceae bacterium]
MTLNLSDRNAEMRLLIALQNSAGLKAMGCRFHRGLVGGIGVTVSEHVLGTWRFDDKRFHFSPATGARSSRTVATPDQAIAQTIALASSQFIDKRSG